MRIIVLQILLIIVCCQNNCHYTCSKCAQDFYQYCVSCQNQHQISIIEDPFEIPKEYKNYDYPTGHCLNDFDIHPNGLGIVLLMSVFILLPITKSAKLFYLFYTLQNFSLFSFVDINWNGIMPYMLSALQYLIPTNLMLRNNKSADWSIRQQSFIRLDNYFKSSRLQQTFLLLGIFNIIAIVLLVVLLILRIARKKICEPQTCRFFCFSQWAVHKQIQFIITFFFFLIQETMLAIIIAYRFSQQTTKLMVACTVLYAIAMIFYFFFIFRIKIPFFTNRFVQYHTIISKKIVYPILVVLNFEDQFLVFVFMFANFILDIFFDIRNNQYPIKSTMLMFKITEGLCIIFGLIYFLVEISMNKQSSSIVVSYFMAIFIILFIIFVFLESAMKIYSLFFKKESEGNKNSVDNSHLTRNDTKKSDINTKNLTTQMQLIEQPTHENIVSNELKDEKVVEEKPKKKKKRKKQDKKQENRQKQGQKIEVEHLEENTNSKKELNDEQENQLNKSQTKAHRNRLKRDPELEQKAKKAKEELKKRYGLA